MNTIKKYVIFIGVICISNFITCQSEISVTASDTGQLKIYLHDAPAVGVEEVNVVVTGINVISAEGELFEVSSDVLEFNLLEFTPDNPLVAADKELPSGQYCQIRLLFGETNTIVINGVTHPLKTPSAQEWQSGFKINGCFNVEQGAYSSITLDFLPEKSIVHNPGANKYILKPVINIVGSTDNAINQYNMQAAYGGDAYVVQFDTDNSIRYLSSSDPRYVYQGTYTHDEPSGNIAVTYTKVITIDPDCLSCPVLDIQPASDYYLDPKWQNFVLMDYSVASMDLQITQTGEVLNFSSRQAFGAFDEF